MGRNLWAILLISSLVCSTQAFKNIRLHAEEKSQFEIMFEDEDKILLKKNWFLQSAYMAGPSGEKISSPGFKPKGWIKTEVPTTVLAALVRQGIYPEPTIGLNNLKIPDAHEDYSRKYYLDQFSHLPRKRNPWRDPYWFWTEFKVPKSFRGKHIWLELKGINYRAEIWLNGQLIADGQKVAGMFGHWNFEITNYLDFNKHNSLAIKIYPLDNPGLPAAPQLQTFGSFGENGGPTGDIGQNVTMQSSIGWDWIPEVRDRNIGLWQPVGLKATGPVDIRYPVVLTELLNPGVSIEKKKAGQVREDDFLAALTIRAELCHLENSTIKGILKARIKPYNFSPLGDLPSSQSFSGPWFFHFASSPVNFFSPLNPPAHIPLAEDNGNFSLELFSNFRRENSDQKTKTSNEVYLEKEIELGPFEFREIIFDRQEWPQLLFLNPKLWWPAGMGFPHLYLLEMSFEISGIVSDKEKIKFGIREIKTQVAEIKGWLRRDFFINGQRVNLRGGAWVPEMLLRREADPEWILKELLLWRRANLNLVRIWGGGVTPPDEFFDFCDELGLLVWHDFWTTGDCQGTWGKGSRDWPLEERIFLDNARSTVLRLRSHPSVFLWTAGNEGYPRREIYEPLRSEIVARLDGTRPFLPSSGYTEPPLDWGLSWPDNQPSGSYSGGPYWWVDPREYYNLIDRGQDWLFKNEVGLPSLPLLRSLKKFLVNFKPAADLPFPLNHIWGFHDACEGNGKYSLYDRAIRQRYGEPRSLADYVWKAQLINAENYRAIFEAANQALDRTTGVILWKTNSAWPSVMWQIYDYYLRPNSSYYFVRRSGQPLHPQLDLRDKTVWVINHQPEKESGLLLRAEIYDLHGRKRWSRQEWIEVEPKSSLKLWPIEIESPSFCLLRLYRSNFKEKNPGSILKTSFLPDAAKDRSKKIILPDNQKAEISLPSAFSSLLVAENFYWISPDDNFAFLEKLPPVKLEAKMQSVPNKISFEQTGKTSLKTDSWLIKIHNPSKHIAFFIYLSLFSSKEEILPSFWDDNFFLLLPGETKEIKVSALNLEGRNRRVYARVEGWNIVPQKIKPEKRPKER